MEGSKLTLVPTVEAGLMVSGLFLLLPPSLPLHSFPSIIKAPGKDEDVMCWQPRGSAAPALAEEAALGWARQQV